MRADTHFGRAERLRELRGAVLLDAYAEHPERFVRKIATPPALTDGRVDQSKRKGDN